MFNLSLIKIGAQINKGKNLLIFEGKKGVKEKSMFFEPEIIEVSLEDDCDDEHCSGKCGVKCPFGWWKKRTHKFEKYKDENGLYQCDKCSYVIDAAHDRRRRYTFGQHLETHLERTIPCKECDKLLAVRDYSRIMSNLYIGRTYPAISVISRQINRSI